MLTEEAEPATRETLEAALEAHPDMVAPIKSQLLEMPELKDDSMSFGSALPLTSRRLPSLRKSTAET